MDLPEKVREGFRAHGRNGGRARAARLTAAERRAIARHAAAARWIRHRFGGASFERLGLPGGEIVDAGIADLVHGRVTCESLAVSLAAPRLAREGVPVAHPLPDPERRLYELIAREDPELAHARYGAWQRRLVSFADACRVARLDRVPGER